MKRLWQIGNIISLLAALVANFLIGAQLVDLPAIKEVSDTYATLLTPASYAFSIWSLIYILLVVFVIYQARDIVKPRRENQLPQKTGPLFMIASVCNAFWTLIFVQGYIGLSVIVLLVLTAALYGLIWRLKIATEKASLRLKACVWWPLQIYAGWVTVASVVNIASWLQSLNIELSAFVSCLILIILTALLALLLITRKVIPLVLASAWGIIAIGVQQAGASGDNAVMITAFCSGGALVAGTIFHLFWHRKK